MLVWQGDLQGDTAEVMVIAQRLVIDVLDLPTLRFECGSGKCSTAVTIELAGFQHPVIECPGCGVKWLLARGNEETVVRELVQALRHAIELSSNGPFRLKFELPAPQRED
jgi:hypothetical protein